MAADLSQIKTIIVVMMENRSFDHMLGYLSLPPGNRRDVDGLRADQAWIDQYANVLDGIRHDPYQMDDPLANLANDPPHDWKSIAKALDPKQNGTYPMTGYVQSFADYYPKDKQDAGMVMGYYGAAQVPITDFLARNFTICDRWFSSLPASTQPNRLMGMAGYSRINDNQPPFDPLLPDHYLVYDWLNDHGVRWRVYHECLPFFAMMPRWWDEIVDNNCFRPFDQFRPDIENAGDDFPQVVFLEPTYTDSPHLGGSSDDHAPSAIHFGQEFLLKAYEAATLNPDVWAGTVMVITYDEHGGFFDHVRPPAVVTDPPSPGAYEPFTTLGPRGPGFVVSPFVAGNVVHHEQFDHTSVLKFIAERFGHGQGYSAAVDKRDVRSVSVVLDLARKFQQPPGAPSLDDYLAGAPRQPAGYTPGTQPTKEIPFGFKAALDGMRDKHGARAAEKFGPLMDAFPKAEPGAGGPPS